MKVLVTPTSLAPPSRNEAIEALRADVDEVVFADAGRPLSAAELVPLLADVDGVIAGLDHFDAGVFDAAPRLRVVSRYGAGHDRVDLAAAAAHGVVVTCTPGANTEAVAELAWGLMLAAARRIPSLDRDVRDGGWPRGRGLELCGKTLGVVGFGAIGRAVARRAAGFSMRVLAYDPALAPAEVAAAGAVPVDLDRLLSESDVVSLHAPLSAATHHLVDAAALRRMRPGAVLVNTSRGGLIDEDAVADALDDGRLAGAGLDVFESEPPLGSRLVGLDTVVCTPHTGAHTTESVERMARMAVANLLDVLHHGTSANAVAPAERRERGGHDAGIR